MVLRISEVQGRFFGEKSGQHAVWMHSAEVDALFRLAGGNAEKT